VIRNWLYILMGFVLVLGSRVVFASDAEQGEHHLPHNHVALFAGAAFEEQDDGHREQGNILGFEYVRQVTEHWGWGVASGETPITSYFELVLATTSSQANISPFHRRPSSTS